VDVSLYASLVKSYMKICRIISSDGGNTFIDGGFTHVHELDGCIGIFNDSYPGNNNLKWYKKNEEIIHVSGQGFSSIGTFECAVPLNDTLIAVKKTENDKCYQIYNNDGKRILSKYGDVIGIIKSIKGDAQYLIAEYERENYGFIDISTGEVIFRFDNGTSFCGVEIEDVDGFSIYNSLLCFYTSKGFGYFDWNAESFVFNTMENIGSPIRKLTAIDEKTVVIRCNKRLHYICSLTGDILSEGYCGFDSFIHSSKIDSVSLHRMFNTFDDILFIAGDIVVAEEDSKIKLINLMNESDITPGDFNYAIPVLSDEAKVEFICLSKEDSVYVLNIDTKRGESFDVKGYLLLATQNKDAISLVFRDRINSENTSLVLDKQFRRVFTDKWQEYASVVSMGGSLFCLKNDIFGRIEDEDILPIVRDTHFLDGFLFPIYPLNSFIIINSETISVLSNSELIKQFDNDTAIYFNSRSRYGQNDIASNLSLSSHMVANSISAAQLIMKIVANNCIDLEKDVKLIGYQDISDRWNNLFYSHNYSPIVLPFDNI